MTARMLKYRLPVVDGPTAISMYDGATIRVVGSQQPGEVCLWVEAPAGDRPVTRTFQVAPTGGDVPAGGVFVGTAFDGPFVWHVFEVTHARLSAP
jgi:hypothetical protein